MTKPCPRFSLDTMPQLREWRGEAGTLSPWLCSGVLPGRELHPTRRLPSPLLRSIGGLFPSPGGAAYSAALRLSARNSLSSRLMRRRFQRSHSWSLSSFRNRRNHFRMWSPFSGLGSEVVWYSLASQVFLRLNKTVPGSPWTLCPACERKSWVDPLREQRSRLRCTQLQRGRLDSPGMGEEPEDEERPENSERQGKEEELPP